MDPDLGIKINAPRSQFCGMYVGAGGDLNNDGYDDLVIGCQSKLLFVMGNKTMTSTHFYDLTSPAGCQWDGILYQGYGDLSISAAGVFMFSLSFFLSFFHVIHPAAKDPHIIDRVCI
jgi:hypothetical protein